MLSAAKHLSRGAPRCFAALSMTALDLSVDEKLSSSFEPCLSDKINIEIDLTVIQYAAVEETAASQTV